MNNNLHSFLPSQLNVAFCAHCNRSFMEHSSCEACGSSISQLALFGKILMCNSCLQKEYRAATEQTEKRVVEYNDTIVKSQMIDQSIELSATLFNAATVPLIELEQSIQSNPNIPQNEKHFHLASIVKQRLTHFQSVLIEKKKETVELENTVRAYQQRLNKLVSELQIEKRIELGLTAIELPKQSMPKHAPKITKRTTTEDKAIANYMIMMKIDERAARELVRNQFREMGIKCSCSEAPGTCKLHS